MAAASGSTWQVMQGPEDPFPADSLLVSVRQVGERQQLIRVLLASRPTAGAELVEPGWEAAYPYQLWTARLRTADPCSDY